MMKHQLVIDETEEDIKQAFSIFDPKGKGQLDTGAYHTQGGVADLSLRGI